MNPWNRLTNFPVPGGRESNLKPGPIQPLNQRQQVVVRRLATREPDPSVDCRLAADLADKFVQRDAAMHPVIRVTAFAAD